jgi:hypothetical protein
MASAARDRPCWLRLSSTASAEQLVMPADGIWDRRQRDRVSLSQAQLATTILGRLSM